MIKHVVLFKFKPGTTQATVDEIYRELAGLKQNVRGLLDFAGGPYSSPEGLNQGYTHGFIITFDSPASRDAYLPHPEHERVKGIIIPHLDSVVAFDFEV